MTVPLQDSALILVVDDDKFMRVQLSRAMEQAGYQVAQANDGEQAIAAYTRLHPDIVLLDVVMPIMDGFTCCRELQKLPGGDRTPVLMLTALEDRESVDLAFEAGASDYITKPIHWAVLRQRVRRLLQASRAMEELRQQKAEAEITRNRVINILESITDAFYALDKEWRFTYLNQHAEPLLQRTRTELLGKSLWDEFPETVGSVFYEQYHKAVSQQIAVEFEEFYPPLNTWFAVHAYPAKDGLSVYFKDITERKRLEAITRERQEQLSDCLENANVGMHWVGVEGTIIWANQAELDLLGYSRKEYIGQPIAKFHADKPVVEDILRRLKANETLHDYEARLWCKDGSIKHVLINSNVFWKDGDFIHTRCFSRDISERKQIEAKLHQTTQLQQAILDSANYTIISTAVDGTILTFNAAAERLLRYAASEIVGKTTPSLIHDWEEVVKRSQELSQELGIQIEPGFEVFVAKARLGKLDECEWTYIRKDGSRFPVLLSVTALRDAEGNITGFLGIGSDITDRKRVEVELQRQSERSQMFADITLKIRQSLQLDEILQTTVTEVQTLLQADRVLLFRLWSNGYGQIIKEEVVPGWPSVLGRGITDDCFGTEYLRRYIQGRIFTIADVEKADILPCLVDFLQQFGVKAKLVMPILLKQELWGLLIAHQCSTPRQWSSDEIELLRQIADQIGIALAQAHMLAEETRQREELARSNAELQQFASIASHDLQEPLRKIQAFGNRLKATCDEALSEQGRDYLERMQNAASRMQTLIEDLLTFSRITTKALPFVSVNLNRVTQEVLSDLELQLSQTKGRVEVGELPTIEAEPVQMRQLLQNLISNALKFHREGEPPVVKIYSRFLDREQQLVEEMAIAEFCQIIVEDNGIGFDEKYLDRIFNVFQRLHNRSEYEGTGMGLAIVRKIAERHGGSITAESTLGQGATFIVTQPTKQPRGENLE